MAEIKSTLELVLEKTRNLKFSSEEKRALQNEEAQKAFSGLLQKYLDQQLKIDALQQGVADLKHKFNLDDRQVLRKVIVDKLDLHTLNGPLLFLLDKVFSCDTKALSMLSKEHRREITTLADNRRRQLEADIKARYEVWGQAVSPNLEADTQWMADAAALNEGFARKLEKEKEKL